MIRQRVTRHGDIFPLPPPEELPGCTMPRDLVGVVKAGTARKWLEQKKQWDTRFKRAKARVRKKRLRDMAVGYEVFGEGEVPPPSALAGRRKLGAKESEKKKARSMGMSLWALWGSRHDRTTVQKEQQAGKTPELAVASASQGQGARAYSDLQDQEEAQREGDSHLSAVHQVQERVQNDLESGEEQAGESKIVLSDKDKENAQAGPSGAVGYLSAEDSRETGVTGKRVMIGGLATPFSLSKEAETESMITLATPMDQRSFRQSLVESLSFAMPLSAEASEDRTRTGLADDRDKTRGQADAGQEMASPLLSPLSPGARSGLEKFVTAEEDIPVKAGS